MNKWQIISIISKMGTTWLDRLLDYYDALNTKQITERQAQEFYENFILKDGGIKTMDIFTQLSQEIEKQTAKEYEYSTVRGCGMQILAIVGNDENMAALILEDFAAGQTVQACEKEIKKWVDENHKGSSGFCPPQKAEEIIRQFFGLGSEKISKSSFSTDLPKSTVDLADFL